MYLRILLTAGLLQFFLLLPVFGEYRAYLLEVYDIIDNVRWEVRTGMTPDMYFYSHGGPQRIRILKKATWMCYDDTSNFEYVCDLPTSRFPKFEIGDRARIILKKHVTQNWIGTVEVALWREDLRSNVYGIRFDTPNKLYAIYFERDLARYTGDGAPEIPADSQLQPGQSGQIQGTEEPLQ